MLILTGVFGKLGNMPAGGVPYPAGLLRFVTLAIFFDRAVRVRKQPCGNSNLISKVYFPRLIVPASSVITSLVDFLISGAFLGLMIWYRFVPPLTILFLPLFMVLAFTASLGAGLWIAALMVKYRDFRFIFPFIVQFGLYISPVGFTTVLCRSTGGSSIHLTPWSE